MASITEGADDPNRSSQRRAAPAPLVLAQVEC